MCLSAGCTVEAPTSSGVLSDDGQRAESLIQALRELNADVTVERSASGRSVISVDLTLAREVSAALRLLGKLKQVDRLDLMDADVSADDLQLLGNLPTLRWLNLSNTHVGDADLSFLEFTPELEFLLLWCTDVGNEGLRRINSLRRLQKLDLSGTKITGEALAELAPMQSLLELYVEVPGIGVNDVEKLRQMLPRTLIVW
jgi:hypothetical protein